MRLLFDENLSRKLAQLLISEFPQSTHVADAGLRGATDRRIWDYARSRGFAIVSKDTDFRERSYLEGAPPKVIWLDVSNAGTAAIAKLLRSQRSRIERFERDDETSFLILSLGPRGI